MHPRRYLQKTVRNWALERASAWKNQGNIADEVATELTPMTRSLPLGQASKGDNRCTDTEAQRNFKGASGVAFLEVKGNRIVAGRDYHF